MFRFTIRDLLWLMVVVGLACGWGISHRRLNITHDRLHTIVADLVSRDCKVEIDDDGIWINYPPDCSGR